MGTEFSLIIFWITSGIAALFVIFYGLKGLYKIRTGDTDGLNELANTFLQWFVFSTIVGVLYRYTIFLTNEEDIYLVLMIFDIILAFIIINYVIKIKKLLKE